MLKLMSRDSTLAVETGFASGDSACFRCHCFHPKKPPTPSPATTSSVKNSLINWFPLGGKCCKSGLCPCDSLFKICGGRGLVQKVSSKSVASRSVKGGDR